MVFTPSTIKFPFVPYGKIMFLDVSVPKHIRIATSQEMINPITLRKVKIVCNFGLSECNRVKSIL